MTSSAQHSTYQGLLMVDVRATRGAPCVGVPVAQAFLRQASSLTTAVWDCRTPQRHPPGPKLPPHRHVSKRCKGRVGGCLKSNALGTYFTRSMSFFHLLRL